MERERKTEREKRWIGKEEKLCAPGRSFSKVTVTDHTNKPTGREKSQKRDKQMQIETNYKTQGCGVTYKDRPTYRSLKRERNTEQRNPPPPPKKKKKKKTIRNREIGKTVILIDNKLDPPIVTISLVFLRFSFIVFISDSFLINPPPPPPPPQVSFFLPRKEGNDLCLSVENLNRCSLLPDYATFFLPHLLESAS